MKKMTIQSVIIIISIVIVNRPAFSSQTIFVGEGGSIQQAIDMCEDGDQVMVDSKVTYTGQLIISGKNIRLTSSNTSAPEKTIINADGASSALTITGDGINETTVIKGFKFTGGTGSGGGIFCEGSVVIEKCLFEDNTSYDYHGAGLFVANGSPTIKDCTFRNNGTYGKLYGSIGGGAYANNNSSPEFIDCLFENNNATEGGGVCVNSATNPRFTNCTFTNNKAQYGSGINSYATNGIYNNCSFSNNTAKATGAVYLTLGEAEMNGCTFDSNINNDDFLEYGGSLTVLGCKANIQNCIFENNSGIKSAGIYCENMSKVKIQECSFTGNSAVEGAAIMTSNLWHNGVPEEDQGYAFVNKCQFNSNVSEYRGGAVSNNSSKASYVNCMFSGNSVDGGSKAYGGAVFNSGCNADKVVTFANCVFFSNYLEATSISEAKGGAMYNEDSPAVITNCTFKGNKTQSSFPYGGAVYNIGSDSVISNSIFRQNDAYSDKEIYNNSSNPVISYSLVYGSGGSEDWDTSYGVDGGGNIDGYSYFVSTTDLRLKSFSPCIDAGNNFMAPADDSDVDGDGITSEFIEIDIDGNPRFLDHVKTTDTGMSGFPGANVIDMGAYEYQDNSLNPDINGDGDVNMMDLSIIAEYWLAD